MVNYLPSKQTIWVQVPLSAFSVAQGLERVAVNHKVSGSNPLWEELYTVV